MRTIVDKHGTLFLGKQGENLAREIAFREPVCWAGEFGGQGTAQLLVRPAGGGKAYPVILEAEEDFCIWRITAADTAQAGYGSCELRWSVEDRVVKSKTFATFVAKSVSGGDRHCACGPMTSPADRWSAGDHHCVCGPTTSPADRWSAYLEQIAQAGAGALEAAVRAENAALHPPDILNGTWWIWDQEKDGYADTGIPASGSGEGAFYRFGHGLKQDGSMVSVDTADGFEGDKTRPITAAAVETAVGNIEILLETI